MEEHVFIQIPVAALEDGVVSTVKHVSSIVRISYIQFLQEMKLIDTAYHITYYTISTHLARHTLDAILPHCYKQFLNRVVITYPHTLEI